MAGNDSLQEILASVGKVLEGQAQLQNALQVLTEEQRQHGERLSNLEQKLSSRDSFKSDTQPDSLAERDSLDASDQGEQGKSSIDVASMGKPGPSEAAKGDQEDKPKSPESPDSPESPNSPPRTIRTMSSFVPWEDYDVRSSKRTSFMTSAEGATCGLPQDWPTCVKARRFGGLPMKTSALATIAGEMNERITMKYVSMVALDSKTHRGRCIFDPSGIERIAFDMLAMLFLLYDLCLTPVTIAWDFPMSGWLLYCTAAVAVFWTLDMMMTLRTAYYHSGKLETRPAMIFRRYARTTFVLDLFIVCVDWLTVFANTIFPEEQAGENPEVIGAKLVRFSKATRVVRIVSVTRVVRIQVYLEHLGDRLHGGSSSKYVGDMARLIVIIVWINHIMSCTWFYIGRVTVGDTGTSWLNDPIRDENSPFYSDTLPLFQYTTAFHWAITQMTPGSMQVFPRNSLERLFNIFALVFGMIFFSSLISSLSATMVNFRMKSTQTANQMAELRRFLRQADISNKLSLSVQKQANERLMEVKPLMVTDVKALGVLSADVRSELQCQPYLMRNGFYRVCQHVEPSVLKSIMVECINFTFYRAGEAAFEAGETAKSAFFIERGTLEYQQNRKTSKVKRKLRVGAHNEIIIAEAALWTFWDYVGTLTAPNPASMLKLDVEKHTKIISESELMGEFAAELALHFRTRLAMAKPPQAPWPNDIEVPSTSFDEMIVCASSVVRNLVSRIGLELVKDQVGTQWATAVFRNHPRNIEELEREVIRSKCMLMANTHGDVERLAAVSTINISRRDGTSLLQLGTWDPEVGLRVSCKLPGTKQELGETAQEAMSRVLETDLLPFKGLVDLSQLPVFHEVEWSRSEKYNMRTKYLRTIFQLEVRNDMDLPLLQRLETDSAQKHAPTVTKRTSFRGLMSMAGGARIGARRSRSNGGLDGESANACIADTHEIVGLPDGDSQRVLICGWLHEEEVDRFRGEGEGKVVLERLMSRIHIDELTLSCVKDLTPTILPISDGSEIVTDRPRITTFDLSVDDRSTDNRSEEMFGILGQLPKDAHTID